MQKIVPNSILLAEVGRLLDEGKDVELLTKGNSMLPFIHGGKDSVVLRKFAPESLNTGDIILAEVSPSHYVLHRLVSCDGDRLTLHGDGNLQGVEQCLRKDVLGTAVEVVRPGERHVAPPKAVLWNRLPYVVRRYFLAFYKRTILKLI